MQNFGVFYPFFGIGDSEWHSLDRRYQDSRPASECISGAIGAITVSTKLVALVKGADSNLLCGWYSRPCAGENNQEMTTVTQFHYCKGLVIVLTVNSELLLCNKLGVDEMLNIVCDPLELQNLSADGTH